MSAKKILRSFLFNIWRTIKPSVLLTKPSFIIVGAQKAGTTGLFAILKRHSHLVGSLKKEVHYFDNDNWYHQNDLRDYHACFPPSFMVPKDGLAFEASPLYLFHENVAERLKKYNPELKIIVVLREPASRALSAWKMYHHKFKGRKNSALFDHRSFRQAIADEITHKNSEHRFDYIKRGQYAEQIERYLKHFGRDQILFLENNMIKNHLDETVRKICTFLNIPYMELQFKASNVSAHSTNEIFDVELQKLREHYQPYNEELWRVIGENYRW
ncbi:MAG: sulfotransferase [Bacteroidota bacterium]